MSFERVQRQKGAIRQYFWEPEGKRFLGKKLGEGRKEGGERAGKVTLTHIKKGIKEKVGEGKRKRGANNKKE